MAGRHRKPSTLHRAHHRGRHRKPSSRPQAVVPAVVVVAALAVGGVVFGHALASGQPPQAASGTVTAVPPVASSAFTPGAAVPPSPSASPSPDRRPTTAGAASSRHSVAAFVLTDRGGACYVQIETAAGKLVVRRILQHGQQVTVREHHLRVVLGNAGAAWISLDGRPARRAGRTGKVAQLRFS